MFNSIVLEISGIDKLLDFKKGTHLTNNSCQGNRKECFFNCRKLLREENALIKNMNIPDKNCHWIIWIYSISSRLEKMLLPQVYRFWEKVLKSKKRITFLNLKSTFHKFGHKMETGWATRMVEPNLETRNENDVCVLCMIYLFWHKLYQIQKYFWTSSLSC